MDKKEIIITGDGMSKRIYIELSGIAFAGFWIGLGIVIAATLIADKL